MSLRFFDILGDNLDMFIREILKMAFDESLQKFKGKSG